MSYQSAPTVKYDDWLKAWHSWAGTRKRGKMAQFIVQKLEENVSNSHRNALKNKIHHFFCYKKLMKLSFPLFIETSYVVGHYKRKIPANRMAHHC